jgi:hypothetical protein
MSPSFRIGKRRILVLVSLIALVVGFRILLKFNDHSTISNETQHFTKTANHTTTASSTAMEDNNRSPVCQPYLPADTTIRRIYFQHMRKAGGTSIRQYFQTVANVFNLEFECKESKLIELPGSRNDTLYLTNLREPIARSISHYKFEYRWNCQDLVKNKTFVATIDNQIPLEEWISTTFPCKKNKLWKCSRDCFIRWLNGCNEKKQLLEGNRTRQFQQALSNLRKYHLVLDIDQLFDKNSTDYASQIENWFGVGGLVGASSVNMWCFADSRHANQAVPLVVSNASLAALQKYNERDSLFYKTVTACPQGITVPSRAFYHHVPGGKERLHTFWNQEPEKRPWNGSALL